MNKNTWVWLVCVLVIFDFSVNAWSGIGMSSTSNEIKLPELRLDSVGTEDIEGFKSSFFAAPVIELVKVKKESESEENQVVVKLENPTLLNIAGGQWKLLGTASDEKQRFAIIRESINGNNKVLTVFPKQSVANVVIKKVLNDSVIIEGPEGQTIQLFVFNYKSFIAES